MIEALINNPKQFMVVNDIRHYDRRGVVIVIVCILLITVKYK